jgi:Fur family transcriptional regulator, peroxide stress response regulator
MKVSGRNQVENRLTERLGAGGLRSTPQREHIYDVLLQKRDHPTAEELFIRAKRSMPDISLATVYNCLDALVQCDLVRQVQLDRGATRFCPNMREHGHFYCHTCDTVYDVDLPKKPKPTIILPHGFKAEHFDVAIHGTCPDCAKKNK